MDLSSFMAATNPRVISCLDSDVVENEMSLAGVHAEGVRIMAARGAFLAVRLDGLDVALAGRVKTAMLAAGSDAAIEESAWAGGGGVTPIILLGTRRQYKDLLKTLGAQGRDAVLLAEAVAETLDNYNMRSFTLKAGGKDLRLEEGRPAIMGILNVTPDSFADGGRFFDEKAAIARGVAMAAEGADIIDVGGESTRPGSRGVDTDEEARRVTAVVCEISKQVPCAISIDTAKSSVARAALDAGATIINDVTALSGDAGMAALAGERGCGLVLMHMKGTPRTMQKAPFYRELIGEITAFLREAISKALSAGVCREQIVVDPGIGFGKTLEHNIEILRRLKEFASLGRPILVGVSRKAFIGAVTGAEVGERMFGTAGAVAAAAVNGAHVLRVHDVKEMKEAAAMAAALAGRATSEVK